MAAIATTFIPAAAYPRLPPKRTTFIKSRRNRVVIRSQQGENEGKSVDENMIVLRMRIKKLKVIEGGGGEVAPPPSAEWKEWERRVFTHYHEGVCDSVEMLQAYLMNTRPSVALGMVALIAMAVPFSSSVVVANALKIAKGLLAGCHVCIDIDF